MNNSSSTKFISANISENKVYLMPQMTTIGIIALNLSCSVINGMCFIGLVRSKAVNRGKAYNLFLIHIYFGNVVMAITLGVVSSAMSLINGWQVTSKKYA